MPMSQYAGDPDNYPEEMSLPDDSDIPDASEFNVANENSGDRTAVLRARSRGYAGANWPFPSAETSLGIHSQWSRVVYDPVNNVYWVSVRDTSNAYLLYLRPGNASGGLTATYSSVGTIDHPAGAVIPNPTNGDVAIWSNTVHGLLTHVTGAWTVTKATSVPAMNSDGVYFNSLYVAMGANHLASATITSTWSTDGIVWNDSTFAVTGFRFLPGNMVVCPGLQPQVICLGDEAASTEYLYTLDGKTWFTAAMPITLGANERVISACWDNVCYKASPSIFGGLVILTQNTATFESKIYIGFTLVKTFANLSYYIASNDGEIVVQIKDQIYSASGLTSLFRLIRSIDNGATWQKLSFGFANTEEPVVESNSSNLMQTRYGLTGGGGGFGVVNQTGANGAATNTPAGVSGSTGLMPAF